MDEIPYSQLFPTVARSLTVVNLALERKCHFEMPSAIINGTTLRIDKAGRVILPKPVRDRFGLREGTELELLETPDGVVLKPVQRKRFSSAGPGRLGRQGRGTLR